MTAFPFQNTFDIIKIKGEFLREAFEHSVSLMTRHGQDGGGRFLQVVIYEDCEFFDNKQLPVASGWQIGLAKELVTVVCLLIFIT